MKSRFHFLIGICLSVVWAGCQSLGEKLIQEPKIALSSVGLRDVGANGATLLVGLEVENPNPFNIRVDALKYDVDLDGKRLSSSELPNVAVVEGHGRKVIELPLPVRFQDLFASALDFLSKNKSLYRVRGEARFGPLKVPFDKSGDLSLR